MIRRADTQEEVDQGIEEDIDHVHQVTEIEDIDLNLVQDQEIAQDPGTEDATGPEIVEDLDHEIENFIETNILINPSDPDRGL